MDGRVSSTLSIVDYLPEELHHDFVDFDHLILYNRVIDNPTKWYDDDYEYDLEHNRKVPYKDIGE